MLSFASAALAIFLLVAGAGWYSVRELHKTSVKLATETLPGLMSAGLAEQRMNQNRFLMRQMLGAQTAARRAQMIEQIKTNRMEGLWQDYTNTMVETVDREHYQIMMQARSNYAQGCQSFFDLMLMAKTNEAAALFWGDLSKAYQDYNTAARALFDYKSQQGIARARTVLVTTTYSPWLIAGLCVLMFVFGLLLGVRFLLSGGG